MTSFGFGNRTHAEVWNGEWCDLALTSDFGA
jgi:hypothetical protein